MELKLTHKTERMYKVATTPDGIQRILGYLRHRVETTFSVLESVFNFERPKSRSLAGLIARTTTKILAHTISFFLVEILTPELSN